MSLLMEALRKAEEAKRRMQQEEQAAAANRDGAQPGDAPLAASPAVNTGSPFTLEEREDLTPDFIRENFTAPQTSGGMQAAVDIPAEAPAPAPVEPDYVPEPEPSARNLARRQQRAAAASVFQAKQSPARNRKTLTILVIVMLLVLPLGGGVLWYLQSAPSSSIGLNPTLANYDLSTRSSSDAAPRATAPGVTPPTAPAAANVAAAQPQTNAAEPVAPAASEDGQAVAAATPPEAIDMAAETEAGTDLPTAPASPQASAETTASAAPPVPAPANAVATAPLPQAGTNPEPEPRVLEISRTRGTRQLDPDLVVAYESLQSGDLTTAGRLYQQLLDLRPNNRDALLGLALVHQRQDNPGRARELYARLLQLNPRDALAQTGLLQTTQIADPAEHESALKALISRYPDVAQLTLALGNLYAAQQRWSEAQGAYYNALLTASRGTGPVNPDYAFNLAVSLEQLGKPAMALDYYRQAQAMARNVMPGFDPQQLVSRLAHLEQAQP